MRKSVTSIAAVVFALVVVGCSKSDTASETGSTTKSGGTGSEELTLRLVAKKGDKVTMNLEMDAEADVSGLKLPPDVPADQRKMLEGPQTMKVRSTEERVVTEVKGEEIKFEIKNLTFSAEGSGTLQQAAAGMTASEKGKVESRTYDNLNRRIATSGDKDSNPLNVVFPEQAIKPGYTWSNDTEMNGMPVKANYKYEKLETVSGKECAVISLTFSNSPGVSSPGPLMLWVDRATGWPVKGEGKVALDSADTGLKTVLTFRMSTN